MNADKNKNEKHLRTKIIKIVIVHFTIHILKINSIAYITSAYNAYIYILEIYKSEPKVIEIILKVTGRAHNKKLFNLNSHLLFLTI